MADREELERWELEVTVPSVTVETAKVVVRCGRALVTVERRGGDDLWEASEKSGSYGHGPGREELDDAVADARRIAEGSERHRLLTHALDAALAAESGQDGESRG